MPAFERITQDDLRSAKALLNDLLAEVSAEENVLSGGAAFCPGTTALQALRDTKISFGNPRDNLIRLTAEGFSKTGSQLRDVWKRQMHEQYDFYYMTLTLSLQPGLGVLFTQVSCQLDFGPKGSTEPVVQKMFPDAVWKEALHWGAGLKLGLNGDLDWSVGVKTRDKIATVSLPGSVQANLHNQDEMHGFITVQDFSYQLGRAEIAATGEGNSYCFWRIENPELQQTQTVPLGIVFKVPKGTASIDLTGVVAARPSINWLADNLRNVYAALKDALKHLLSMDDADRTPVEQLSNGTGESWHLELPAHDSPL